MTSRLVTLWWKQDAKRNQKSKRSNGGALLLLRIFHAAHSWTIRECFFFNRILPSTPPNIANNFECWFLSLLLFLVYNPLSTHTPLLTFWFIFIHINESIQCSKSLHARKQKWRELRTLLLTRVSALLTLLQRTSMIVFILHALSLAQCE